MRISDWSSDVCSSDLFIGFVKAAREAMPLSLLDLPPMDIDWPCYSGKTRQPLWFLLAAKLLAQYGLRILLHDAPPASTSRQYTRQLLADLKIPHATTPAAVAAHLAASGGVHNGETGRAACRERVGRDG